MGKKMPLVTATGRGHSGNADIIYRNGSGATRDARILGAATDANPLHVKLKIIDAGWSVSAIVDNVPLMTALNQTNVFWYTRS